MMLELFLLMLPSLRMNALHGLSISTLPPPVVFHTSSSLSQDVNTADIAKANNAKNFRCFIFLLICIYKVLLLSYRMCQVNVAVHALPCMG